MCRTRAKMNLLVISLVEGLKIWVVRVYFGHFDKVPKIQKVTLYEQFARDCLASAVHDICSTLIQAASYGDQEIF